MPQKQLRAVNQELRLLLRRYRPGLNLSCLFLTRSLPLSLSQSLWEMGLGYLQQELPTCLCLFHLPFSDHGEFTHAHQEMTYARGVFQLQQRKQLCDQTRSVRDLFLYLVTTKKK